MTDGSAPGRGPILRLFEVRVKPGSADDLLRSFATTSAAVVSDAPGNEGYFFGRGVAADDDRVVFASVWESLEAVKKRFGDAWRDSYLPPGYETMIEDCSVSHFDLTDGWCVKLGG